jgi:deazaflavin-dependent oxidoreductase (nitroreductase family)
MAELHGDYIPSTLGWVKDQIETYERSGGKEANTLLESGIPVIIVTMRGAKSGAVRKIALMRVEHNGAYALVASKGGAPGNPDWYTNLVTHPNEVLLQDGPEPYAVSIREVHGAERDEWWKRSAAVYAPYDEYQAKTSRTIPVIIAERK